MSDDRYKVNETVFIRARIMGRAKSVGRYVGTAVENEYMLQQIDAKGVDVPQTPTLFISPQSIVSVSEAREIIMRRQRGS